MSLAPPDGMGAAAGAWNGSSGRHTSRAKLRLIGTSAQEVADRTWYVPTAGRRYAGTGGWWNDQGYGKGVINMRSDRPAYKQLADLLRTRIVSGEFAPGQPLPSETTLMQEHGVSRNTVRGAIQLLRAEGHVITEHGRGTRVRERPPVHRIGAERYRADAAPEGQETSFTRDHGIGWQDYQVAADFREVPAGERIAGLLDIAPDDLVLECTLTFYVRGEAQQISMSIYPLALVEGTPLTDPEREPWPGGAIARLRSIGVEVTRITESVTARMPMPDEAEALLIEEGTPVVVIERRMFAGDRPVEVADIVLPADRVALDYVINL